MFYILVFYCMGRLNIRYKALIISPRRGYYALLLSLFILRARAHLGTNF